MGAVLSNLAAVAVLRNIFAALLVILSVKLFINIFLQNRVEG